MKNQIFSALLTLGLMLSPAVMTAQTAPVKAETFTYKVTGVAPKAKNGAKVYMQNMDDLTRMDSTVVKKGKFTFTGTYDVPQQCVLQTGMTRLRLVVEPGEVMVNLLDEKNATATGTPLNDAYAAYDKEYKAATHEYILLSQRVKKDSTLSKEELKEISKKMWECYSVQMNLYRKFFEANKKNVLGIDALFRLAPYISQQEQYNALLNIPEPYCNYRRVKQRLADMKDFAATQEGAMFKDFVTKDANGKEYRLSDYVGKGKYTLVDFWASWCKPCRGEIPNIKKVWETYGKDGQVNVLGIAVWDKEDATRKAMDEDGVTWPVILNAGDEATKPYGVQSIPQIMLFGPDGKIVRRGLRGGSIMDAIEKALGK